MRIWFNRHFSLVARVVELLRKAALPVKPQFLVSHRHHDFAGLLSADQAFLEPSGLAEADYVQWCLDTARQQRVDWIVPGHAAAALAQAQQRFADIGVRMLSAAPARLLPLLEHKDWVYAHAPGEVPRPRYQVIEDPQRLAAALLEAEAQGPACIKPCVGVYGQGFHRLQSAVVQEAHGPLLDLQGWQRRYSPPSAERRQLLMEYLPGQEYSVDLACADGQLLAAVVRCKPLQGVAQTLVDRPDLSAHAARLVHAFQLHGLINVQFKDAADGQARLLEINPRAAGGIAMSCLSGLNLPEIAYRACVFDEPTPVPQARLGLRVAERPVAFVVDA